MKYLRPEQIYERGQCQLPYILLGELPLDEMRALQGWMLDSEIPTYTLTGAPEGAIYPWLYERFREEKEKDEKEASKAA